MLKPELVLMVYAGRLLDCWAVVESLGLTKDVEGLELAAKLIVDGHKLGPRKHCAVAINQQAEATSFT